MFRSPTSLPHRLSAQAYWSEEQYQRELPRLQGGWQLVGHLGELSRAGDFITCSVLGQAVQVMERSELVAETLGEHVFDHFLRNKRAEWVEYRRQVTPFELSRYLPVL